MTSCGPVKDRQVLHPGFVQDRQVGRMRTLEPARGTTKTAEMGVSSGAPPVISTMEWGCCRAPGGPASSISGP